jgi:hypothetical protein
MPRSPARKTRTTPASRNVLSGAHKWLTGILTTSAAIVTLALNARNLGLSPWLGLLGPNVADHAAQRIVLTPRADTLRSLGDSAVIAATVTDARGAILVGATLRWRSSDSTVAAVDSSGTIVARAPGRATIEARVREVTATAAVLVRQVPARLAFAGDTLLRVADGDSMHLAAVPVDARGSRLPGMLARWHSPDTTVVRVDSTGALQVVGAGTAAVEAAFGDLRLRLRLDAALTPAAITLVSGAGQRALAGRALPRSIVLQVLGRAGQPVPGTPVLLMTEAGEGAVEPATATSDAEGRVRAAWTLGPRAGTQRLYASVPTLDTALTVEADVDPSPGNVRTEIVRDELRGTVGRVLDRPVRVRVTDTLGVALAGVRIAWTPLEGGAADGAPRTDSLGNAEARWTLGKRAGSQRLRVQVGDPRHIPGTDVRADAMAGAATALVVRSGQAQSAVAGTALAKPIVVQVRDSLGNPVPDASVRTVATAGAVQDVVPASDSLGRVMLRWTLGEKAGAQRIDVHLVGGDARVATTATARVGRAEALTLAVGPVGARGTRRVTARVTDAHGNPVPRVAVAFSTDAGALNGGRVLSDSAGRAAVTWTPPVGMRTAARIAVRVAGIKTSVERTIPAPAATTKAAAARPKP